MVREKRSLVTVCESLNITFTANNLPARARHLVGFVHTLRYKHKSITANISYTFTQGMQAHL